MNPTVVDALKSYLERIGALEENRSETADEIRALYAEAKVEGFVPKAMRGIIKRRRAKNPTALADDETMLDTYMHAVGMAAENPLAAAVGRLAIDVLARDQVLDTFMSLVPVNGEIIARIGGAPMRIWRTEDGQAFAAEYVEPKPAPADKPGRGVRRSATVPSIVPSHVNAAADAAEARSKAKKPDDQPPGGDDDGDAE